MKEVIFIFLDDTYTKNDIILSSQHTEKNHHSTDSTSKRGEWLTRGSKRSQYMDYIAREDEDIYREHLEQMEKKQSNLEV